VYVEVKSKINFTQRSLSKMKPKKSDIDSHLPLAYYPAYLRLGIGYVCFLMGLQSLANLTLCEMLVCSLSVELGMLSH
jgi:hypothetical protein